jgi:glycosyltransferase involved in cell wall biosynthesis
MERAVKAAVAQKNGTAMTRQRQAVALVLLNNSGIGGAERRFARVYQAFKRRHVPISLIINESLLDRLVEAGIFDEKSQPELVLKEPMGRLAARFRQKPQTADKDKGNHLAFAWRKLDYVLACVTLARWLVRRRPDLLHLVLGGAYIAMPSQWFRLAPQAVVSIVCPSLRDMVGSGLGYRLYRRALRRAKTIDALTEDIAAAVKREGVPFERIQVSPGSCVDMERFKPAEKKQPWVTFAGRFIEEKNPCLFVEACALVHRRLPEVRFFMLGEGPMDGAIKELVKRHGLETCMQVEWSNAADLILGQTQVFASLQRMDNYPSQALLEAMACGTAVVATDVGLTRKLVDESVGLLVQPEPAMVADAIIALMDNPVRASELGRQARERVARDHSMDAYLNYLDSVYARTGEKAPQKKHDSRKPIVR